MPTKAKDVAVSSVTIKIGGRELNLTVEEAQKLKRALEELFGRNVVKEVIHKHDYIGSARPWKWWYADKTYCSSSTDDFVARSLRGGSKLELSVK